MPTFVANVFGKDAGGFAWENVFHVANQYTGDNSLFKQAGDLASFIETTIKTAYLAAMVDEAELLGFSARAIAPDPSITAVKASPAIGTRDATAAVGAVNGRIAFVPHVESTRISSFFVTGVAEGDYVNDAITIGYQGMLEALGDAFLLIDGTESTYHWQLVQWHQKTQTSTDIDEYFVSPNPTTLNKRIRA